MKNISILIILFILIFSCKQEKALTIKKYEGFIIRSDTTKNYKVITLEKYNSFYSLIDDINRIVCNDSIPEIILTDNDVTKKIIISNFCYSNYGCVLIRQRNVIEIYKDTIYKSGKKKPIDSLFSIMKKDYFNLGIDPNYSVKPSKLIFYLNDLKGLKSYLNKITTYYDKLKINENLNIVISRRLEIMPPPKFHRN